MVIQKIEVTARQPLDLAQCVVYRPGVERLAALEEGGANALALPGGYIYITRDLLKELKTEFPFVSDVRGKGLLLALEFDGEIGRDVVNACMEEGLLLNAVKPNALRFMPPLNITNKEADEAVDILHKVLPRFLS